MCKKYLVLSLLFMMTAPEALGWIYSGNHDLSIVVDRPEGDIGAADVVLHRMRVHKCAGGFDAYDIDESIDAAAGWSTTISGGNLCGVSFDWDSDMSIGATSWSADYTQATTSVTFDGTTTLWKGLTPITVTDGEFSGQDPRLYVMLSPQE